MRMRREFFTCAGESSRRRPISSRDSAPWRRRQPHTFCERGETPQAGVRAGQRIRASLRGRARNGGERRRRGRSRAYGYDGAEVVGDDVNSEEDAVLRHHGGAPAAAREALVLGARCGGRRWSRRA